MHVEWLGATSPRIAKVRGLEANTTPAFRAALWLMANRLGLEVDCIAGTISLETGGTFSPSIKNPNSTATGLIQFLSSTARKLGTTTAALAAMSAVEQLYYVEKFYEPHASRIRSCCDHYLAVFMPDLLGRAASDVAMTRGDGNYEVNSGFDRDGDGVVYVSDICVTHNHIVASGRAAGYLEVDLSAVEEPKRSILPSLVAGVAVGAAVVVGYPYVKGFLG